MSGVVLSQSTSTATRASAVATMDSLFFFYFKARAPCPDIHGCGLGAGCQTRCFLQRGRPSHFNPVAPGQFGPVHGLVGPVERLVQGTVTHLYQAQTQADGHG